MQCRIRLWCGACPANQASTVRAGSNERYLKIMCTEGCVIFYHYPCWRAFERFHKASHTNFNWKVLIWFYAVPPSVNACFRGQNQLPVRPSWLA